MIVLKNIPIILFSIICSHAPAVEPRTKPAVQVEVESPAAGVSKRLEFRVLPNGVGSSRYPISPFELPKYVEELKKNGPEYGKDYIWLPIELQVGKEQDNLIKQEYDGRIYVLASNKRAETMADDGSWNISGVDRERDGNAGDYHSITARFDEYGQHLFSSLTNSHVGHVLAIVREGKVIYTSLIKRRMWKAAIDGDFTEKQTANLMYIFEDYRKPWQEPPPFLHNLDRQVWSDYIEATEALAKGRDRAKLAKTFLTIGSKYLQTTHCQTAIELGDLLQSMAKEEQSFIEPEDIQQLSVQEKIDYFIFKLRDVAEQETSIPGKCKVLFYPKTPNSAAVALKEMGTIVIPAMISHLEDRRPTRSVGLQRNGGVVLRNCDVALEIIESIAGRKFDFRTARGTYLSTASERLRDRIIEDVKQWWQKNKQQPAVQVERDFHVTRQKLLRLLALPEPQLRHAREAIQLFKVKQDWPSLAIAYEVAAETMWRVTHMAPEAFIRPATEQATDVRQPGFRGPYVMVQTNLDGEWVKGKGGRQNWIGWIQRKQKDLALERIAVLKKLGALCLDRLDDPPRAVLAYEATGRGVPVCTEPLETLIAQMWPVLKVEANEVLALDHVGAAHIRLEPLQRLAEAQVAAGDLRGAADTRLRAMLTAMIGDHGDWNAHYPMQEAEAFWRVVRRLPLDQPLPPTLWLRVLDPQHPEITVSAPEDGPHGYPRSHPGPRVVIRPGHTAQTLTVAADMETPGGSGGVRCFTIIKGKVHEIGWVEWRRDGRRGRGWRQGTFDVPEDVGIIRLEITPFNGSEFHIRNLKVEAAFAASGILPIGYH